MRHHGRTMPRKRTVFALSVAALLAACGGDGGGGTGGGGTGGGGPAPAGPPIRIGVAGPISGPQAKNGEDLVEGTTLAVEDWNAKGGVLGRPVEMIVRDDEASPAKAKQVAQQLIAEKVVGVVGHFNSGCTQPASEEYAKRAIVMITPSSTNPAITDPSRKISTIFRTCGRDDQQGHVGATFVSQVLKMKKVFVLDDKTQYGAGLAGYFAQRCEAEGVVVLRDGFTDKEANFEPYIAKIKAAAPDAVFFGGIYSQFVPLLRQARERGVKQPFIGGDGVFYQKEVVEAAGGAAEGCFVTFPNMTTPEFVARYRARFGQDRQPGPYAIYAYDAATILLGAIDAAKSTEGAAIAAMIRSRPWTVASGVDEFDANGDLKVGYKVWEVRDNRFVLRWQPE